MTSRATLTAIANCALVSLTPPERAEAVAMVLRRIAASSAGDLPLSFEDANIGPKASAAHYDIVPTKRAMALKLGAVEVTGRDLVRLNYDGLTRRGGRGDAERAAADQEARALEARIAPRPQTSFADDDVQKTRERDAEREGPRRTRGAHRKPRPAPAIIVAQLGQDDDDT